MNITTRFISQLSDIPAATWDQLTHNAIPFLDHRFLLALEVSGCVGGQTAWQPHHLIIEQDGQMVAAMPGYLKYDSYGEYVFDHAWANAYYQHNMAYYPKWVSAIPFTPVSGARLLLADGADRTLITQHAVQALAGLENQGYSSTHILFSDDKPDDYKAHGYLARLSVQFQWHNYAYESMDDFLSALTSRKRKSLNKAQRQLTEQQVELHTLTADEISDAHIAFFIRCYQQTYLKRSGHSGYLSADFFYHIFRAMRDKIMLVVARQQGEDIASALYFYDENGLYGRYWGALKDVDGLHFACCYTCGIAFAIDRQIPLFNPGTQGEHKILRGFEPVYCYSLHRLFARPFHHAVDDFLGRERIAIIDYFNQARDVLPFNSNFTPNLKTIKVSAPPA
ncbi:GNAT family N-acetyltransferase [Alteromonas halophila]|uniref:GNAT family N-acetyltransferase n=1 Tax=Alteromonas halophila TaxID=516698 RepID=A0A918JFW8_9ALTE|nr:GNAT family N-acetyltransferase [Alteromonas halophila]GGW73886.1 hypothetical protein GCM10007391_02000 [Alteromonas halophila]